MQNEHILSAASVVRCCTCFRPLSMGEINEFYGMADGALYGEAYCRACTEAHLPVCRECSCRRTTDPEGVCDACAALVYALAG